MAADDRLDESQERTSLDLLEREDRRIMELWRQIDEKRGTSVEDRADYGNLAKLLIRHLAVREAAALDVADGLSQEQPLRGLGERFAGQPESRREHMDRVERLSRGIQGIDLNTGQDFDGALLELFAVLRPQLEWDLDEGIPEVRSSVPPERCEELFHTPAHVSRHAPTSLDPHGPTWWERAPVISRLITIVHHLRDYPRATRDART